MKVTRRRMSRTGEIEVMSQYCRSNMEWGLSLKTKVQTCIVIMISFFTSYTDLSLRAEISCFSDGVNLLKYVRIIFI